MEQLRENTGKLHAVCMPYPAQGHISPMFKLAKLLHSKGFHITFVNTEYNHRRLLRSRGANALDGLPSFRFEAIPDGLPFSDSDATQDIPTLSQSVVNYFIVPFKELILRLNAQSSSSSGSATTPVTFILSDTMTPFTHDAARQLGIPLVLLWTSSACGFLGCLQFRPLIDRGISPFKDSKFQTDGSLDMVVDWIPSMKGMQLKYIPSFFRTTNKDDIMFNFVMLSVERAAQSTAPIIFNTFDALEHDVLEDISKLIGGPMYNIGPLHLQLKYIPKDNGATSLRSNLWKEDSQCLQWLDSKKPQSVVYVSYGSITTMTNENLIEFAWGLANSNYPFLWIVRPDLVSGDTAVIPPEFIAETKGRGLLAAWCDQEQVLNHPSIGVFLSHCGWNSTLEAIGNGVPILCWPFFAEQQTNCWFMVEKWKFGMETDSNVKREDIERQVREVMEGEKGKEMRKNAIKLKKLAEEAIAPPDGPSYVDFEKLINQMLLPLKQKTT